VTGVILRARGRFGGRTETCKDGFNAFACARHGGDRLQIDAETYSMW